MIIRAAQVSEETQKKYEEIFMFETTDKAELKQSSIATLNVEIQRYLKNTLIQISIQIRRLCNLFYRPVKSCFVHSLHIKLYYFLTFSLSNNKSIDQLLTD